MPGGSRGEDTNNGAQEGVLEGHGITRGGSGKLSYFFVLLLFASRSILILQEYGLKKIHKSTWMCLAPGKTTRLPGVLISGLDDVLNPR